VNDILVVDDEPDMRVLVREIIDRANEGLRVVGEAGSGSEALARWRETNPTVIVLDQRMPGDQILRHPADNGALIGALELRDDLRGEVLPVDTRNTQDLGRGLVQP